MENEIMVQAQATQLSANVFSDKEAFQSLFDIAKMFASPFLIF